MMPMQLNLLEVHNEITSKEVRLDKAWLDDLLGKLMNCEFCSDCSHTVVVDTQRVGLEIILRSRFMLDLKTDCSLCARNFDIQIGVDFQITLKPMPIDKRPLPEEKELSPRELDEYYYQGDAIDLGEILREQIILSLPMYPRCSQECKGLCPTCGADLNFKPCECEQENLDPRWTALKNISKH